MRDDGLLNLSEARTWAQTLIYFGTSDWRLPMSSPSTARPNNYSYSTDAAPTTASPTPERVGAWPPSWGHLFYVTLGNAGEANPYSTPGFSGVPLNVGSFRNLTSTTYWSGPAYGQPVTSGGSTLSNPGWDFDMWDGSQDYGDPVNRIRAVAVHNGDVFASAVPEPGTYAMLLMGLALLAPVAGEGTALVTLSQGDRAGGGLSSHCGCRGGGGGRTP